MKIVLVRHGDAEPGIDDSTRRLTEEGKDEARRAGRVLAALKASPDFVVASPLVRAQQTAKLILDGMGISSRIIEERALVPEGDPIAAIRALCSIAGDDDTVIAVSHLPLVGLAASAALGSAALRFSTGSFACIEGSRAGSSWTLQYHLNSKAIKRLSRSL